MNKHWPGCPVFFQGELINNIEKNVSSAQEYVEKAKEETKAAVKVQKTSRTVREHNESIILL